MLRYFARRLLQTVPVLLGTTFLIYAAVFALPGDPIRALAGDRPLSPSVVMQLRERYNLNDPLLVGYVKYLGQLARGNFGEDFYGNKVTTLLSERWPVTVKLGLTAWVIEAIFGVALGVVSGVRRGGVIDNGVLFLTTLVLAVPALVLAFISQLVLGVDLKLFPVAGITAGWPRSYLLPAIVLASLDLAFVARLTRTTLIETLRADFVRTAVAKGLGRWRVVGKHALRNSLIPVITFLGVSFGYLMGGAVVIEGVFNLPGVGQLVYSSIQVQEGTVVVGVATLLVLIFITVNFVVDILYAILDPRIRYE